VDAIFANQSAWSVESVFKGVIGQRWAIRGPGIRGKKDEEKTSQAPNNTL
jgi:hypothetical protein